MFLLNTEIEPYLGTLKFRALYMYDRRLKICMVMRRSKALYLIKVNYDLSLIK